MSPFIPQTLSSQILGIKRETEITVAVANVLYILAFITLGVTLLIRVRENYEYMSCFDFTVTT